jgi:hypothetical protein
MRAWKNPSSDDIRERYLGEIALLLDAARQVDCLSPAQKKQVHKRVVRTLFRTRFLSSRVRLVPVLAALGMLVIGGAAFATAERLGLIPTFGPRQPSAPGSQPKQEMHKRKAGWAKPSSRPGASGAPEVPTSASTPASLEGTSVVLPEVPDPLLLPVAQASTAGWDLLSEDREPPVAAPAEPRASAPVATPAKLPTRPSISPWRLAPRAAKRVAFAAPATAPFAEAALREMPAPNPTVSAQVQQGVPPVASRALPAVATSYGPVAPLPIPASAAVPSPLSPAPPPVAAQPAAAPATRQLPSDQALFGQAMRKLRMENDPAAALSAVQEHARAYPRSSLGGERSAIEVEALLALHRDREALARLDAMAIEDLPRSGERFVVRGELRAAARRWPEASDDFDRALARVSGSPAWNERALWGRGVARLRCGEREAGMADLERYRDSYPHGRFATEAAKFFLKK